MKQTSLISGIIFAISFLFLSTAQAVTTNDIKTAILKEDFDKAKELSASLLSGPLSEQEEGEVRYCLALSELYLGAHEKALGTFKQVVQQADSRDLYDQASIGVVNAYYLMGNYDMALNKAKILLDQRPDSNFLSIIYLKIARANLKLTQWDQARKVLRKIVEEFSGSLEAFTAKQLLEEKKYFTVQVGAFLDQKRAEKLVLELKLKGQYGYIVEMTDKDGQKFYRVRIGELTSLEKAKRLRTKLSDIGYPTIIYP
ncbi:MAG: SPOR domain-containing protein [Candidatus Aceula lacicola]|nr:SPOR domain-containing protein [Candidatus Aceula lacicola]